MPKQGIRIPTVGRPQDTASFAQEAEAAGFDFAWVPDTPWLAGRWRDAYVHLTATALATSRLRLGPGVTNPLTRHPLVVGSAIQAIDDASDGRADLVVGTGYSSAYIIGEKAAALAKMRESVALWRTAFRGEHFELPGAAMTLEPPSPHLPIYLAASGPKALALAGEIADGVLVMVGASAGPVRWALERIEAGMTRAGRARSDVKRIIVMTACVDSNKSRAIDQMRPAAANLFRHRHAKTLLKAAGVDPPESIPPLPFIYPDMGHAVDWEAAKRASSYVPDSAVEALIAVGAPEEVAARTREIIDLDIDALWWRDEQTYARPDALMRALAEEVFPLLESERDVRT